MPPLERSLDTLVLYEHFAENDCGGYNFATQERNPSCYVNRDPQSITWDHETGAGSVQVDVSAALEMLYIQHDLLDSQGRVDLTAFKARVEEFHSSHQDPSSIIGLKKDRASDILHYLLHHGPQQMDVPPHLLGPAACAAAANTGGQGESAAAAAPGDMTAAAAIAALAAAGSAAAVFGSAAAASSAGQGEAAAAAVEPIAAVAIAQLAAAGLLTVAGLQAVHIVPAADLYPGAIVTVADLAAAGILTADRLAERGINTVADLTAAGIVTAADLAAAGIATAADASAACAAAAASSAGRGVAAAAAIPGDITAAAAVAALEAATSATAAVGSASPAAKGAQPVQQQQQQQQQQLQQQQHGSQPPRPVLDAEAAYDLIDQLLPAQQQVVIDTIYSRLPGDGQPLLDDSAVDAVVVDVVAQLCGLQVTGHQQAIAQPRSQLRDTGVQPQEVGQQLQAGDTQQVQQQSCRLVSERFCASRASEVRLNAAGPSLKKVVEAAYAGESCCPLHTGWVWW